MWSMRWHENKLQSLVIQKEKRERRGWEIYLKVIIAKNFSKLGWDLHIPAHEANSLLHYFNSKWPSPRYIKLSKVKGK